MSPPFVPVPVSTTVQPSPGETFDDILKNPGLNGQTTTRPTSEGTLDDILNNSGSSSSQNSDEPGAEFGLDVRGPTADDEDNKRARRSTDSANGGTEGENGAAEKDKDAVPDLEDRFGFFDGLFGQQGQSFFPGQQFTQPFTNQRPNRPNFGGINDNKNIFTRHADVTLCRCRPIK